MRISAFMVKAHDVVRCTESDRIETVIDAVLDRNISAVVVVGANNETPVGIVTKTDLVKAFQKGISTQDQVGTIMVKHLKTVLDTENRDAVAKAFEHNKHHHAVVVDKDGRFKGLVSSWDVAVECAKDSRAWPWIRPEEGRVMGATGVH